ncbi:MAG TPA: bifunctional DNA-formamidopyrimidine glycosylase/DNA-(apurinic or apyrimidinic site) lyase [Candidatus Saccharimonadales bacterium]|nr:bifunctional DNA-formamidopyrimidine glycosylase/DNA-(apurinic or apyrimidinic site) lyase [Candidatus Saccharimonadales bacterium]
MPELPEVETVRRGLEKYVVGHVIECVELRTTKQFTGNPKDIEGATIIAARRFGKGMVIDLSNNFSLAIHIKLTGQLIYRDANIRNQKGRVEVPNTYTHVIFWLDDLGHSERVRHIEKDSPRMGEEYPSISKDPSITLCFTQDDKRGHSALFYNDIRQFGWIKVVPTDTIGELPFFKGLGPEFSLGQDSGHTRMTEKLFGEILSKSKTAIKPLLMDQAKMAGVGNIYANDSLYVARIDPKRPANSLSDAEVKALYNAVLQVLKKGLEEGGASELTFVNILGELGNYQNHSQIYGKNGEKCKRDQTIIQKITLGGRGTYFCPNCQK